MQITLLLLSGFLFSVLFGMVIIPRILVISHKKRLYDVPDSRKVHTTPVPRLGGLSFFPVILMSMFLVIGFRLYFWDMDSSSLSFNMLYEYLFLFVGMTLLYLVGVCDNVRASVLCRYPIHLSRSSRHCINTLPPMVVPVPWEACSVYTRFRVGNPKMQIFICRYRYANILRQ